MLIPISNLLVTVSKTVDFVCRNCFGSIGNTEDDEDLTLNGDFIEMVTKFSYLGDVLHSKREMQEAITAGIRFE